MEKNIFNKGDFVKYVTYSTSKEFKFGIFEGVELPTSNEYSKKYSLALFYDSNKYFSNLDNGVGWGYQPFLDIASKDKPCDKQIDTLEEDSWWKVCSDEEKEAALRILEDYGYAWNEETMEVIDLKTGEIVHKIIVPKIEYNGEIIKPIEENLKDKLKQATLAQNSQKTTSSYYSGNYSYGYQGYNRLEYWD
jgi:hypothetical protein